MTERLRKRVISGLQVQESGLGTALDLAAEAEVLITSESDDRPIDHVVDGTTGPGSTQWVAGSPGPQTLVFRFDRPHHIVGITFEVEEREVARTQEVTLEAASAPQDERFREIVRQEYTFAPQGTTFEREELRFDLPDTVAVRMTIKPDKGKTDVRAKLNHIAFMEQP